MSNYVKATNFTAKDSLPSGNSGKIIKGAEIDTELTAVASAISSKADLNSPALTGTPTAPTATTGTNTTQLATTAFVQTALAGAFSTGMIMMWSGTIATIPSGWVLCNGSNGTPDLRNRFVIGAHSDTTGVAYSTVTGSNTQTGGTKDAINVSHTHTVTAASTSLTGSIVGISESFASGGGTASGVFTKTTGNTVGLTPVNNDSGDGGGVTFDASHTHSMTVSTEGSSGTNQNLPPYYALAFIMKT
jgi:hypothetical protein